MKTKLLFIITLAFILFIAACDEEKPPENTNPKGYLISKNWKIIAATQDTAGANEEDLMNQIPFCVLDNTTRYYDNGTLSVNENDSLCNSSDPQQLNGKWEFKNNKTVLSTIISGDTLDANILELNVGTLKLSMPSDYKTGWIMQLTYEPS